MFLERVMANVYLTEENTDDLARMVVGLLSEFWIMRDRMAIMEELLVKSGVLAPDAIENFSWTPAQAAEMEKLRDKVVASVIGAPLAAQQRSVDRILELAGFQPKTKAA
jgi:hypothetical protein